MGREFAQIQESAENEHIISEVPYTGDQSPDFDNVLKKENRLYAHRKGFSERTTSAILVSEWQVTCHVILTRSPEGICQALHVQPDKISATLLSFKQEQELKKSGEQHAAAIVARGKRAWFGPTDEKELLRLNLKHERTIDVDTNNWWRLLYNPITNEIWIDVKDKKLLIKYEGF
jgi:hypothetical protein